MQHLNEEELARLVDEEPTEEEVIHLELCPACSSELEAISLQTEALRQLPDLVCPPHLESRLRSGLAVEGLLLSNRERHRSMLRVAASVALFAAGGLAGFTGRGALPGGAVATGAQAPPANISEATQRLEQAEAAYSAALADYARVGGAVPAADPVSRLAALEGIVLTTRAALNEAPADPVINGYHFTALQQRNAMLRQIQTPQPSDTDNDTDTDTNQEWY